MILNQRTTVFLDYIRKREGFMDSFLKHLGTSAIMDLLLQMIVANDGDQNKLDLALVSSFLVLPLCLYNDILLMFLMYLVAEGDGCD